MSFRLFIYHCAAWGGFAALAGWALGLGIAVRNPVGETGLKGLLLGLLLGLMLGLVDALGNVSPGRHAVVLMRALVATVAGAFAGLAGGLVGQSLFMLWHRDATLLVGWALTGLLVGGSLGAYDLLSRFLEHKDARGARRKVRNGVLGGAAGGLVGGALYLWLRGAFGGVFGHRPPESLWTPVAAGFAALGACIGLMIGLAQVLLKEAWVRVESGFRPGRELILGKNEVTIGRGEGCDVGLFGDPRIERRHARIVRDGDRYLLADDAPPGATLLNGRPVSGAAPLRDGDLIRVGGSTLRFGERRKPGDAR
jgi:MFS family permease